MYLYLNLLLRVYYCSSPRVALVRSSQTHLFPLYSSSLYTYTPFYLYLMQRPTCTDIRVRSVSDALVIFYAVSKGVLPIVSRRLDSEERRCLRSGSVYVWEERGPDAEATGVCPFSLFLPPGSRHLIPFLLPSLELSDGQMVYAGARLASGI
jgi:hypothetical protein